MRKRGQTCCRLFVIILCLSCASSACKGSQEKVEEAVFSDAESTQNIEEIVSEDSEAEHEEADDGTQKATEEEAKKEGKILVYICGQVLEPGVYELAEDDRIAQAIQAAGGMTSEAADTWLNQAEKLTDGQRIYVPTKEEAQKSTMQSGVSAAEMEIFGQNTSGGVSEGKVNLNTAEKSELMTLNGIGETRAEAIIAYRQDNGGFQSIEEIQKIEGIKGGIFDKIKDQITVE